VPRRTPATDEEQPHIPIVGALSQSRHDDCASHAPLVSAWVANEPASRLHRFDSGRRLYETPANARGLRLPAAYEQ
jgi:hypothetical protein